MSPRRSANLGVGAEREAPEHRHRLPLRPGADEQHLLVLQFADFLARQKRLGRVHVPGGLRGLRVLDHRAAFHDHPAALAVGKIEDVLDAVDLRGEGRQEDPAPAALDDLLEVAGDLGLARRVARALGVGRVGDEQQHAVFARLLDALQITHDARAGAHVGVDLEVAGVQHVAHRGLEDVPSVVGNRVGHAEELGHEALAEAHLVAIGHFAQVHVLKAEFAELLAHQGEGQRQAVDRHAGQPGKDIRQPADVVLVAVGQNPALDLVLMLEQVVDARHDEVDAHLVGLGKGEAAVHHHDFVAVAEHGDVFADFAHAPERNDFEGGSGQVSRLGPGLFWSGHGRLQMFGKCGEGPFGGIRRAAAAGPGRARVETHRRKAVVSPGEADVLEPKKAAAQARRAEVPSR